MWRSRGCFLPSFFGNPFLYKSISVKIEGENRLGKQTLSAWKQGKNMPLPSSVLLTSRIYHRRPRLASLSFFRRLLPFSVSHFFPVQQEGEWWIKLSTWHIHSPTFQRNFLLAWHKTVLSSHQLEQAVSGYWKTWKWKEWERFLLALFLHTPPYLVWLKCHFEIQPVWLKFPFCRQCGEEPI